MEQTASDNTAKVVMLHIFPSFGYGGQQTRFVSLAAGLGADFYHHVVSLNGDVSAKPLVSDAARVEFHTLTSKKSSFFSVVNVLKFRALFSKINPDILCTYNWGSIEAALANNIFTHAPHIHFEDGFGPDEALVQQKKRRVFARRFLLKKSTLVVPSHGLETTALALWKHKRDQLAMIRNGVEFERFQQAPSVMGKGLVVGAVGALRPEKNHGRLINAFLGADKKKQARLIIVGSGDEKTRLADIIEERNAKERIRLMGAAERPEDYYRDFDIFALSSDTEQAPLALMEAMAAGLPVVATNVGDVAEMVSQENLAFVVPVGDDAAFETALIHLLQSPDVRATLGAANRKKAREEFGLDKMIERHRALYLSKIRHG